MANVAVVLLLHLLLLHGRLTTATWCVARTDATEAALQKALDFACGAGADCSPIQDSGSCFLPNTVQSHASYAFNSYYQHSSMDPAACDFAGTATVVETDPSYGSCVYPSSPSTRGINNPATNSSPLPPTPPQTSSPPEGSFQAPPQVDMNGNGGALSPTSPFQNSPSSTQAFSSGFPISTVLFMFVFLFL